MLTLPILSLRATHVLHLIVLPRLSSTNQQSSGIGTIGTSPEVDGHLAPVTTVGRSVIVPVKVSKVCWSYSKALPP